MDAEEDVIRGNGVSGNSMFITFFSRSTCMIACKFYPERIASPPRVYESGIVMSDIIGRCPVVNYTIGQARKPVIAMMLFQGVTTRRHLLM